MSESRTKALGIIGRISGVEPDALRPDMDLAADLGIDSPKALELLVDLEDSLDLEIADEEAARMETVGDILSFVEGR